MVLLLSQVFVSNYLRRYTWDERNRSVRYLSFLPLSHVAEGILASYVPYCLLAKVEFYYLNDFRDLARTLPKVRPTVFFSVPRFYEKLWEQVTSSRLAKAGSPPKREYTSGFQPRFCAGPSSEGQDWIGAGS